MIVAGSVIIRALCGVGMRSESANAIVQGRYTSLQKLEQRVVIYQ